MEVKLTVPHTGVFVNSDGYKQLGDVVSTDLTVAWARECLDYELAEMATLTAQHAPKAAIISQFDRVQRARRALALEETIVNAR